MTLKGIGIRISPSEIHYTILEKLEDDSISYTNEIMIVPKALDPSRQLSYIRTNLFSLICELNITRAGLKTAEGLSQKKSIFRLNLEGVVQELFSNSSIVSYYAGTLTSIASRLGTTSTIIKGCCAGENTFNINDWDSMTKNHRESYLAALASIQNR
ncbi:hypothetical protein [Paenibacillus daejeonensis]|uniref:hypothetical protein n=1 Tax=Paenibacillus daejeonensis TaxID=135193 RepID=UPI0012F75B72|nr:hypothetical protein [Paenibacillus daejeonensis]